MIVLFMQENHGIGNFRTQYRSNALIRFRLYPEFPLFAITLHSSKANEETDTGSN